MFPATFYAQVVSSVAMVAAGAVGYAVTRAEGPPRHRLAWRLFAAVALASGASMVAQDAFGGAALLRGAGSPVWNEYLEWAAGLNYGRGVLWYAFAALLVVHGRAPGGARVLRDRNVWLLFAAAYALGMAAGLVEGPYTSAHEGRYAVLNHGLLVLMTAGLAAAVASDGMDRLLAVAVAAHIAALPLFSSWLWWRSRGSGGPNVPSAFFLQVYYAAFWLVVLAIGLRRLWLARRGVPVPGLMASFSAARPRGIPERRPWP